MSKLNKKASPQEQVIHEYLQSLLLEIPEEAEPESVNTQSAQQKPVETNPLYKVPVEEPKPTSVVGLEQLVAEVPEVITQTVTEIKTEVEIQTDVVATLELQLNPEVEPEPEPAKESADGVPEWAESRFQCLLFNVSGLSLAVPLVKLNSVIPWDENITETPNKTDWYLGLVQHLQNQVKIIDTALLVMPKNRHHIIETDSDERLSHILLVDDYKWGLACSSIGDVIWLSKDEVKWRKNKTSRAWLSGTSLEHLCAIMDTEVFAKMVTESS